MMSRVEVMVARSGTDGPGKEGAPPAVDRPRSARWGNRHASRTGSANGLRSELVEAINFSLTDQVAIVTGASRGIGHDLVLALAGAGATVVAAARSADDVAELLDEVGRRGGKGLAFEIDLRNPGALRAAVDRLVADVGHIDILVNNAGLGYNHEALEVTESDWDSMMDVNLKGLFFMAQAAARPMIERGYGRIVNLSSQAGIVGIPRHVVYAASKGGVNMLTSVLALEWATHGITVNAIAPTFVRTPGTAERLDDPDFAADVLARIPIGRFGTTADVAAAMLYLASPAAGLVTGTVLRVDGGWTTQ